MSSTYSCCSAVRVRASIAYCVICQLKSVSLFGASNRIPDSFTGPFTQSGNFELPVTREAKATAVNANGRAILQRYRTTEKAQPQHRHRSLSLRETFIILELPFLTGLRPHNADPRPYCGRNPVYPAASPLIAEPHRLVLRHPASPA